MLILVANIIFWMTFTLISPLGYFAGVYLLKVKYQNQ
jgi:hypothetical protein